VLWTILGLFAFSKASLLYSGKGLRTKFEFYDLELIVFLLFSLVMVELEEFDSPSMKYVLVSGGVISGVGKGVITSSIGTLLKSYGLRVTAIKIDPYLNIDAGTFSPYEHGRVCDLVYLVLAKTTLWFSVLIITNLMEDNISLVYLTMCRKMWIFWINIFGKE